MAIAYRSSSNANNGATTTLVVTKPSGVIDNDVMLAFVYANDPNSAITTLAGWTKIRELSATVGNYTANHSAYYKVASSEGASYTWAFPSGSTRASVVISAFTGVDTSDVVDVENGQGNDDAAGFVAPTITTTGDNKMLIYGTCRDDGVVSNYSAMPSGMTQAINVSSAGAQCIAYEAFATAGATGTRTATHSAGGKGNGSFLIALNTESASPTTTTINGATLNGCTIN